MIDQAANSLPQVRAGTIKAYAVTDKIRLAAAPDIPTVDEAGVPGLHIAIWHGIWTPKGTPKAIIDKLNAAIVETLADAGVRERLAQLGPGDSRTRAADPAGAVRPPPRRDREVVADHQGGEHQGGMILRRTNQRGRSRPASSLA